jgi:hypothetical protein
MKTTLAKAKGPHFRATLVLVEVNQINHIPGLLIPVATNQGAKANATINASLIPWKTIRMQA